jgi:hypothetical protein
MSSATPTQRGVYILNGIKSYPLVSSCSMSPCSYSTELQLALRASTHLLSCSYNSRDCFQLASSTYTLNLSTSPLGPLDIYQSAQDGRLNSTTYRYLRVYVYLDRTRTYIQWYRYTI